MSHLLFSLLMAVLISFALAAAGKRNLRERIYHAAWLLLSFIGATVAGGWAMYFIHG
jgi:hypothetical protein